jgi:hypothetical protein
MVIVPVPLAGLFTAGTSCLPLNFTLILSAKAMLEYEPKAATARTIAAPSGSQVRLEILSICMENSFSAVERRIQKIWITRTK